MSDVIRTNWSKMHRPYTTIEVRITESSVQYVYWFDSGKDPNVDSISFANFYGSTVERKIKEDFGSTIYEEVCESLEALIKKG